MAQYEISFKLSASRQSAVAKRLRAMLGPDVSFSIQKERTARSRGDRLSEAEASFEDAKSTVSELKDEMQEWMDSIPENLQNGSKANEVQEALDALESIEGDMENIDFGSVNFPGMY
jgi:hypothetical protein